jgi:ribose-phosphate pyrophosphokinase
MIKFKGCHQTEWQEVKPTIFPDGTSQVWNLDTSGFRHPKDDVFDVKWNFESESEIVQLRQLVDLLTLYGKRGKLYIPYMPYARQDKKVSNSTTFAKRSFLTLIYTMCFERIESYDIHSEEHNKYRDYANIKPTHFLEVINSTKPDVLFFPDKGALDRYSTMFVDDQEFQCRPKAYGEKVRDQSTGNITGYEIKDPANVLAFANVLILDDICDGGATFISAIKELKKLGTCRVDLCVSHGIWSKGTDVLYEAGFGMLYCTDSLKQKEPDVKVFEV